MEGGRGVSPAGVREPPKPVQGGADGIVWAQDRGHRAIPDRQKLYPIIRKNAMIGRARIAPRRARRVTAQMGGERTIMPNGIILNDPTVQHSPHATTTGSIGKMNAIGIMSP